MLLPCPRHRGGKVELNRVAPVDEPSPHDENRSVRKKRCSEAWHRSSDNARRAFESSDVNLKNREIRADVTTKEFEAPTIAGLESVVLKSLVEQIEPKETTQILNALRDR